MEDEERQKKLEAGKAKLAEYRQRKAYADSEDPEGDSQERVEVCVGGEESSGAGQDGSQEENKEPPSSEFTFTRVLQSGETVKHRQNYTIEPESEVSTTAEDCSSEQDEVEPLQQMKKAGTIQAMEVELAAKTKVVEELTLELEEIRAAFGTEGVQQLQDFEAALKQRDGIITQLTANLQQAREEKDETMKEFLELTEQSQMLQIQFQQLQAGETLRNTSHSSTAADLFQARQQLSLYQQQVEELNAELKKHHESSREQLENIEQLQNKLKEAEVKSGRKTEEFLTQSINEKDRLIAEQEKVILSQEQSLTRLGLTEESCAQALKEKNQEEERTEFETCKAELATSRQKERMSSNEIMQLMGTIEDLQKRVHQGNLSESDAIQKMQEDTVRKLEVLRAELDEMYGQQIVQMKQELHLQHAARVEQMTTQHRAELELLKENHLSQISAATAVEMDTMNAKIQELQFLLDESHAKHNKTRHELSQVSEEKINLQVKVEALLQDLDSAKEKVEQVSKSVISQESHHIELHRLQEVIENLKGELALAREDAQEMEAKHDSEITNYKIKLEMLEREKDAVLDRMAESQEAELERLRTQLLFSHEEELTGLREELQRENFLNTENLLNEAAVRHERVTDELRAGYEKKLHLSENEKASCVLEREELLHQILELKEDLKIALHSSKADELVQQLQELQVELEELRKRGAKQAQMENEMQQLAKKTEVLESKSRDQEKCWENRWREQEEEKRRLMESNNSLEEELAAKRLMIETLEADNIQIHQQVAELAEEIKKQRTTFSFAEKNFEVNYQELKEEYTCLIEAKAQLEERALKETLEFEAKIARLQSQLQELEESSRDTETEGKHTTELMEKLNVTLREKESLVGKISEATEQLMLSQSRVKELEEQRLRAREENEGVTTLNESLAKMLEEKQMESQVMSHSQERDGEADSTRGCQGDGDSISKPFVKRLSEQQHEMGCDMEEEETTTEHVSITHPALVRRPLQKNCKTCKLFSEEIIVELGTLSFSQGECRLQMEAQRISLSQIHAAQLELLQEETEARTHSLELRLQQKSSQEDPAEPKLLQSINISQAVQKECADIIEDFRKIFGEKLLESIEVEGWKPSPSKRKDTTGSTSVLMEARALYKDLQQVRETIEQEHLRLSQLQSLLKDDVNKVKTGHKSRIKKNEKQTVAVVVQLKKKTSAKHVKEQSGTPPACMSEELQRLRAEEQEKQLKLEESHREEVERLRAHYQQQATETEERYLTELLMLQQQLQDVTGPHRSRSRTVDYVVVRGILAESNVRVSLSSWKMVLPGCSGENIASVGQKVQGKKQDWERIEEEVAKAIVQMSVQFAQQTELLRLNKGACQKSTSMQTMQSGEDEMQEEELTLRASPSLSSRLEEVERLKRELEERNVVISMLKEELLKIKSGPEQVCGLCEPVTARVGFKGYRVRVLVAQTEIFICIVQRKAKNTQKHKKATAVVLYLHQRVALFARPDRHCVSGAPVAMAAEAHCSSGLQWELASASYDFKMTGFLSVFSLLPIQNQKQRENGQAEDSDERDSQGLERKQDNEGKVTFHDISGSTDRNCFSHLETSLLKANKNLSHVLVEVLKTTAAAEETLGLHMQSRSPSSAPTSHIIFKRKSADLNLLRSPPLTVPEYSTECYESSETTTEDADLCSMEMKADESLKMSHQMIESLLLGVGSQLENEDYLVGISCRLQTALEKMLMVITDTSNQLEHARLTQTELMRESFRHNEEINGLLQKQEELQERLTEEARAREQLALELHRAEGLIDGYTGERAALEEQLHQKEEFRLNLEQELQVTSSRLHELEQERLQMQEERELLSRQQDAMREHAGPRELHLLEETEKLMKEKVEVQRQAEKENADLLKHNKLLEAELEEQVSRVFELEQAQMTERRDLQQQIQALEKQLENNRKFLDEQAVDREHERDFFQQEIQKLEQQLKNQQKQQAGSEHRNQEVERLTSQLKEKADWCSELLLSSEQLRREVQERDEEIDKLESRIRELEQALLASAESLEEVKQKNQHATIAEAEQSTLESQLQTEREALERKEKEICNLEEQLEQFREELENKSEEVQQLHMQLEIQRKEISSQQDYLENRDSLLQVDKDAVTGAWHSILSLFVASMAKIHSCPMCNVMEAKDREIALLNEQIIKLQHKETTSDNKELDGREEVIKELESQVECLRSEQERLKRNNEEEVDQMSAVIDKLQQEMTNIEQKRVTEEDEDTRPELESSTWALNKEEYAEMKQRMDLATEELRTLKTEHSKLLESYLCLKESAKALAETEQQRSPDTELEDALLQKTAGLVVMQAQVQALEQSASSRLEELGLRVQELEDTVNEKECELRHCRLQLEQTERRAEGLQQKASELEVNLRDKVTEAFTIQQQPEGSKETAERPGHYDFDIVIPKMDSSDIGRLRPVSTGKVFHLTQRLQELEVGLSGIQKDQELQKQLLSSSEEEVLEYEKRLSVLMDLLGQMKNRTHQRASPALEDLHLRDLSVSELQQELQKLRENLNTTEEEFSIYKEHQGRTSNQASGKSHSTRPSSRSEQPTVAVAHSSTQTEHVHLSDLRPEAKTHTSDEMEEVIAEFQEKIVQMQELHAAEILDMEARHISESDSLRRDTQALEEECKALQAVIDKLRSPEARKLLPKLKLKASCSCGLCDSVADSSSDYSQRTGFDIPSLQQELRTTPEGARRDPDDPLPDRIKTLLREVHQEGMQVLSLSELPISEGESGRIQGWVKERDDLLTTVESLKGLVAHMQMKVATSASENWRAQLLDAVRRVFSSERNVLKSALYRQLDALDTSDAIIHLNQLERRLAEQDAQHREAMDSLHIADRASLTSEIHQLRSQLEHAHRGESAGYSLIERRGGGGGMKPDDKIRKIYSNVVGGGGGGEEQVVESDRLLMEELKGELSQTKLELETTLKAQHKHLKELDTLSCWGNRAEVSQKAAEVDALNDRLTEEKKRSRDLQWAMEKERCESGRSEESKREELEDLQLSLEEQEGRVAQLAATLEEERQASARLSQRAEEERLGLHRRLQELQVRLETEQAKALEMSAALGRERELRRSGLSSELEEDEAGQEVDGRLLDKLQRELDDKQAQVVNLLSQLEVQRLGAVQKEEELSTGRQKLRREQEALRVARAQLEALEAQMSESQEQLGRELEKSRSLEEEREQLEEKLCWLREQSGRREVVGGDRGMVELRKDAVWPGGSTERTKDWVFQQKSASAQSPSFGAADAVLSKLYSISSKVGSMAAPPAGSSAAAVQPAELSWVQSSLEEAISVLQQAAGPPSVPESLSLLAGGSSSSLTQRLLRQNAELTGFVSRLTEEKNHLRNQTLRLEEEIRRHRQAGPGTGDGFGKGIAKSDSSGTLLSQEREAWAREKVRLERALHQAQAQVARLRGEIRSDTLREITGPQADNAALKRIYGKYLRSESFRKALVYQKKYLLLLLGGFQECEEATLSLLTRMGGQPALSSLGPLSQRRRGLVRFRSAVRVSIALSRMRFLVKRWQKTMGTSATTSGAASKPQAGQTAGTDARDSPYLRPGSLETYRDGGGGVPGGRGRSGRESPRSAASSALHRFHLAGEHGALTCSHLQSYDPDRALSDYISRLEALQRRLGSVTSGAASYAQLHFGLRR
uniref:Pericentrin/AKAP-450 centrosomal targeting domain-containing protein n=1 Tax=Tetraodon nigroviridis TaxID=99883 RepID=H3DJI4_TETNG